MSDKMENTKVNYGNWVPLNMMRLLWGMTGVLVAFYIINLLTFQNMVVGGILLCLLVLSAAMSIYMQICRNKFSRDSLFTEYGKGSIYSKLSKRTMDAKGYGNAIWNKVI